MAFNDRQAVVETYPNAEVTYDDRGKISNVEDSQLGILVSGRKVFIFSQATYLRKSIRHQQHRQRVAAFTSPILTQQSKKIKRRRHLIAVVSLRGEQGQAVSDATVSATWTSPKDTE